MSDETWIRVMDDEKTVTVVGSGDLNLYISPELDRALREAVATGKDVVADLRSAQYIDSAIIASILNACRTMLSSGRRLRALVSPDGYPQHALEIVGARQFCDMVENDAAA